MSTLRYVVAMAAVLTATGCTAKKVAPPPAEFRADLKHLGLVQPERKSLVSPDAPVKGVAGAALTGAGQGAGGTFVGTAGTFCQMHDAFACAFGIVLGAALAPVGAVVGAGVGASKSHSTEEVESAHNIIFAVAGRVRPNEELAVAFQKRAAASHGLTFAQIRCIGLPERCGAEAKDGDRPNYALRLEYSRFVLHAFGRIDPDISVRATIDARIFNLATGAAVYRRQWGYRSIPRPYFDLAKDRGAGLGTLIEDSHATIAATVTRDLLEEDAPVPIGPPAAGRVWTKDGPLVDEDKEASESPETTPPDSDPGAPDRSPET